MKFCLLNTRNVEILALTRGYTHPHPGLFEGWPALGYDSVKPNDALSPWT